MQWMEQETHDDHGQTVILVIRMEFRKSLQVFSIKVFLCLLMLDP